MRAWNSRTRIVAAYAVIAGAVLVGTSLLLEYIANDGRPAGHVELVKNVLFVVVSSLLLYALLKRQRSGTGSAASHAEVSPGRRFLAPLLLLLSLTVPAMSLAVYVLNSRAGVHDGVVDVQSIAALKAGQIADWINERRADATMLAHSEGFIERVAALVLTGDGRERELVEDRLAAMHRAYLYESIRMYTPEGRLLYTSPPQRAAVEPAAHLIQEAVRRGEVMMSDLARDNAGVPILFFVAPLLLHREGAAPQPVGAVVLQAAAASFLQPLLAYWPGESASGESYLVRRHGGTALILSRLRHQSGTGAELDLRPTAREIPGATAPGVMDGVDYRGRRVIEAHEPVPGTDWHLVAKVDRSEATAWARQLAAWTTVISLFAFSIVLLAILALVRAQERAHRLALQARTDRLQKQFFDLPFLGMGITSPESKHWLQFNDQLCHIMGYSRAELAAVTWTDMTHPEDLAADVIQFERVLRGELDNYVLEKRFLRKDGGIVHGIIDIRALRRPDGSVEHFLCTLQDITERKLAEERLVNLGRLYATLGRCNSAIVHSTTEDELFAQVCIAAVESAGMKLAWIGMVDKAGQVRPVASAGPGTAYLEGLEISVRADDSSGQGPTGIAIREDRPCWCQDFANDPMTAAWRQRSAPYGWAASASLPLHRGGLAVGALSLYSGQRNAFDKQTRDLLLEMAADISFALDNLARDHARRRAEELTRALLGQLEYYLKSSPVVSYALAVEGESARAVWVSENVQRLTGYTPEEALEPGWWMEHLYPEDRERAARTISTVLDGGGPPRHEYRFRHRDGRYLWILDTFQALPESDGGTQVIGAWHDITTEKDMQASLQFSEERFRVMFEEASLGMTLVDSLDGRILEANAKFAAIVGRTRAEVAGIDWQAITHPDDIEADRANMAMMNAGKLPGFHMKKRYLRPDGSAVWVNLTVAPIHPVGGTERPRHLAMTEDVTENERTLQALARREAQFSALAEQSIAGIYTAEDGRITYMNPRAAEIFGYTPEEIAGLTAADLVVPEDVPRVRENIRRRLAGEEESQQYEFRGLRKDGSTVDVGVHGNTAIIEGRRVLMGVMQDITEKQRSAAAIHDYVARMDRMITSTVDAMSTMVELRDPYTAGHERRVGELSAAIAAEMGLDDNMQRGLRLAGAVHDVGKIAVPAEILSKPGRLTDIEYNMVREHAQRGYEVLCGIDSPWPVAEVARQHHERMDGSGYPRGLKGDEILLEARILAVADVVESMGSFRPYRPALGVERALAEIEIHAGQLYDPAAAAACLRLFRDRGYTLPA